jgi:aminopeptidase N
MLRDVHRSILTCNRVWSQILVSLSNIKSIFAEVPDVSEGLREFTLKLVTPAVESLGWEFAENENFLKGQLRALLITQAGLAGHKAVVAEACKQFEADQQSIHPSLRLAVFRIAVKNLGASGLEKVQEYYSTTKSVDGKEIALLAMGQASTPELATKVLDFAFSPAVATQDKHSPAAALAKNSKQRLVNWEYVQKHWEDKVFPQLSGNMVVLERWLKNALNKYADLQIGKDITAFFEGKDCKGFDRGLSVVKDTIVGAAKYKERDVDVTREWLKTNGYIA